MCLWYIPSPLLLTAFLFLSFSTFSPLALKWPPLPTLALQTHTHTVGDELNCNEWMNGPFHHTRPKKDERKWSERGKKEKGNVLNLFSRPHFTTTTTTTVLSGYLRRWVRHLITSIFSLLLRSRAFLLFLFWRLLLLSAFFGKSENICRNYALSFARPLSLFLSPRPTRSLELPTDSTFRATAQFASFFSFHLSSSSSDHTTESN